MDTDYDAEDAEADNYEIIGKYIDVEFLYNADQVKEVVCKQRLTSLKI
ncbi:TasA family protein [Virgibacillus dakarensis]